MSFKVGKKRVARNFGWLRFGPEGEAESQKNDREQAKRGKYGLMPGVECDLLAKEHPDGRTDRKCEPEQREHAGEFRATEAVTQRRLDDDRSNRSAESREDPGKQKMGEIFRDHRPARAQCVKCQTGQKGRAATDEVAQPPPAHDTDCKGKQTNGKVSVQPLAVRPRRRRRCPARRDCRWFPRSAENSEEE